MKIIIFSSLYNRNEKEGVKTNHQFRHLEQTILKQKDDIQNSTSQMV